jgi:hypothetical protein
MTNFACSVVAFPGLRASPTPSDLRYLRFEPRLEFCRAHRSISFPVTLTRSSTSRQGVRPRELKDTPAYIRGMESERRPLLSFWWRPFIGFALCQLAALLLMLALSAANPGVSEDLRGTLEPELSGVLDEP